VGDVVDVGSHAGLVEGMSVRSVRLRDFSGTVHTVPFSEVKTVTNLTKDFSYALFDVGVAYRENVDEVMAVLREVGASLQADEKLGPVILEPIEVVGLERFEDSAMIIRARFKTRPIHQWSVMREFNRRLKMAFDERGIEIPFPYRTLVFGTGKDGEAPPGHLVLDRSAARSDPAPETG
jgi:small conductance mechanosensitive channel